MARSIKFFAGNNTKHLAKQIANAFGTQLNTSSIVEFSDGEFEPSFDEIVNIGSNSEIAIADLTKTIHQFTNSKSDLQIGALKDRPTEIWRMCADNSRSKKIFDWQPDVSFEDGLKKNIDWARNNWQ